MIIIKLVKLVRIIMTAGVLLVAASCSPAALTGGSTPTNTPLQIPNTADSPSRPTEMVVPGNPAPTAASSIPTAPTTRPQASSTKAANPLPPTSGSVTSFPDPTLYDWVEVANGLSRPDTLVSPRDGSGRMFVLEQNGQILILQNGKLLPTPFLDISDRVRASGSEQGLLGMAFHPDYAHNGEFFINYTEASHGDTVIARYRVSSDPNIADRNSEQVLIYQQQPFANHNGGSLAFGPDGYLYAGLGDGGSQGDPHGNGQSVNTLLGKLLRINVNQPKGYSSPPDNPFAKGGGKPEIWAYGLRNPWRISFDSLTNDLYIADVGQNSYEEIDFVAAGSKGGLNFGWNYREGFHDYASNPPSGKKFVDPVAEYDHSQGCSVTGGYVYRGQTLPEFYGVYFFGDYCSGIIWGLLRDSTGQWQMQRLFQPGVSLSSFGEDQNGEIYLLDYGQGRILKLVHK